MVEIGYNTDDEELQLDYEEACNEVAELQNELRAAKLEAQQMRLRLQAAGVKAHATSAVQKPSVVLPEVDEVAQEQRIQGIRDTFQWIADNVDLEEMEYLAVNCEVPLGNRLVHLQEVVQWPLPSAPSKKLRVSVPVEYKDEIAGLLKVAKSTGRLGTSALLGRLADTWELVPGELSVPTQISPEPAVLLAHRKTSTGILVASWPTPEALEAFSLLYAPEGHVPRIGDKVEILYEGDWFLGKLESVDATGRATVKCDVDAPGVYTVVPFNQVRHLAACATWQQPAPPTERAVVRPDTCPAGHTLQRQVVPSGVRSCCDQCREPVGVGEILWACRQCNYDKCCVCYPCSTQDVQFAAGTQREEVVSEPSPVRCPRSAM